MSDNPITQPLASSADLEERLKRTDEARWLASRYAEVDARRRLVAVWLFRQELQRALQASDPMLAKIRLQWWRETLDELTRGSVRRHDITEELSAVLLEQPALMPGMIDLTDRYDDIADDHLQEGGHGSNAAHVARHGAAEAAALRLGVRSLGGVLSADTEDALAMLGDAAVARAAEITGWESQWALARNRASTLSARLWPAIAHLAVADAEDALVSRWRVFKAVLLRRLPRD